MSAMEFINMTDLDEEVVLDLPVANDYYSFSYLRSFVFIGTCLCLVGDIAADTFLLITIFRFKKLRTRLNMLIANFFFIDLFAYLKGIFNFIIMILIMDEPQIMYCLEMYMEIALVALYCTLVVITALYWFMSGYKPKIVERYDKYHRHFLIGLYTVVTVAVIINVNQCISKYTQPYARETMFILYITTSVIVVIINILKKKVTLHKDSVKTEYCLTTVNVIIIFFCLPIISYVLLTEIFEPNYMLESVFLSLKFIPEIIAIIRPIIIIYVLGRRNKYFKMAYEYSFKKSVRNYDIKYLNDESDEEANTDNANVFIEPPMQEQILVL